MDPSPKIPAFHLAGHSMGVRMSAFRASQCTPHVLEATKTSSRPVKKNGNQTNYLPRRHAHYGSIQRLSHRTHYHRSQPVIQPRFRDKRREVCISTYSGTRVPRVSGKFSRNVFVPPTGQGKEFQEGLSVCDKQPFFVNQNTLSTSRKTVLFDTSSLPSTPALPLSSDGQNNGFEENSKLRIVLLNQAAQEELLWWRDHLAAWNGRSLLRPKDDLLIETDASNLGWGACCNGVRTGGLWSHQERLQHINCLELMAGGFAIKSFCKNRASIQVKLLMDNTTAIAYINRMGGSSHVLASLVYEIWQWCLQREISITAQHIPGIYNNAADRESRVDRDSSDWKLDPIVFARLNELWGPLEVDLFATRLTNQLPRYVSWRPDPEAEATDAFSQDWSQTRGYAFPPFSLVGRCLSQVQEQDTQHLCLVAPVWETQPWYPLLLHPSVDFPRLFPTDPGLLGKEGLRHPFPQLQLAGWLVSANATLQWEFQTRLKDSLFPPSVTRPLAPMSQPGVYGVAGAVNKKLIPFLPLFST